MERSRSASRRRVRALTDGDGGGPLRAHIAHLGPDPATAGGMPAVIGALVSSPLADRFELEAIPTYRDSRPLPRLLLFGRSVLSFARWCARPGARIAHVHMAARGSMYRKALVVGIARVMGRPVILQVHAGPGDLEEFIERLGPMRRRLLRATLEASDVVLSVSTSGGEVLRGVADVPIDVVPNAPPPVAERPAAGPPKQDGLVEVIYLGGFADPAKGGAILLDALPDLLRTGPGVEVELAGPGEAPGRLPERARWSGFLDEAGKARALRESDIFVLPSLSEGMPMALLEAMAHGLPIVASRVGAVPEVLTDGTDALLVEPGDAGAMVEAVATLVADPERRRALGDAAAERARRLADEDVYQRLAQIYLGALR